LQEVTFDVKGMSFSGQKVEMSGFMVTKPLC